MLTFDKKESQNQRHTSRELQNQAVSQRLALTPPPYKITFSPTKQQESEGNTSDPKNNPNQLFEKRDVPFPRNPVQAFGLSTSSKKDPRSALPSYKHTVQKKENKTRLPDALKSGVEQLSGISMDDAKVHYNSDKPSQLQAHAYAQGTDIHIASGQEKHLPHEAWHVAQQKQGRVKPTMQMQGVSVNDDKGLEKEADVMGAKAMQMKGLESRVIDTSEQKGTTIQKQLVLQRAEDIYSKEAYDNPLEYLRNKYEGAKIEEDAGSGGILDDPMRRLVGLLSEEKGREKFGKLLFSSYNSEYVKGENESTIGVLMEGLYDIYDKESAYNWIKERTLQISKFFPKALIITHDKGEGETPSEHIFHKDHGFVKLTTEDLSEVGINSKIEQTARLNQLNGPFKKGWVRGHNGVMNMKHRFIEHIHVDKDASEEDRMEIYNSDNVKDAEKADEWLTTMQSTRNMSAQNDGKATQATIAAEGTAKRLAWEEYFKD